MYGPKAQLQQLKNNGFAQPMTPSAAPFTAQGASSSSSPRGTNQIGPYLLVQTPAGLKMLPSPQPATGTFSGMKIPTPKSGDNSSKPTNRPTAFVITQRLHSGAVSEPKAPSKASANTANKVSANPVINSSSSGAHLANPSTAAAAAALNRLLKPLLTTVLYALFRGSHPLSTSYYWQITK